MTFCAITMPRNFAQKKKQNETKMKHASIRLKMKCMFVKFYQWRISFFLCCRVIQIYIKWFVTHHQTCGVSPFFMWAFDILCLLCYSFIFCVCNDVQLRIWTIVIHKSLNIRVCVFLLHFPPSHAHFFQTFVNCSGWVFSVLLYHMFRWMFYSTC